MVLAAIRGLAEPAALDPQDTRTPAQRQADALIEICHRYLNGQPAAGSSRPHLQITIPWNSPADRHPGWWTPKPGRSAPKPHAVWPATPPSAASSWPRRHPGGAGEARRSIPPALRRALDLRDQHCTHPGCDVPARWCDAHHIVHWADGGKNRTSQPAPPLPNPPRPATRPPPPPDGSETRARPDERRSPPVSQQHRPRHPERIGPGPARAAPQPDRLALPLGGAPHYPGRHGPDPPPRPPRPAPSPGPARLGRLERRQRRRLGGAGLPPRPVRTGALRGHRTGGVLRLPGAPSRGEEWPRAAPGASPGRRPASTPSSCPSRPATWWWSPATSPTCAGRPTPAWWPRCSRMWTWRAVVTLGAFIGQVAHTVPVPLIGAATDPALLAAHHLTPSGIRGAHRHHRGVPRGLPGGGRARPQPVGGGAPLPGGQPQPPRHARPARQGLEPCSEVPFDTAELAKVAEEFQAEGRRRHGRERHLPDLRAPPGSRGPDPRCAPASTREPATA